MKWNIIIYPDETGGFVAECPALPGCISQGETVTETRRNIRAAIRDVLQVMNARARRENRRHRESRIFRIAA